MSLSEPRIVVTDIDLDSIGDEWETLVSAGQMIAEAHDRNRWLLGDLGNKIEKRYSEDAIGQYARAINVRPSTMYDYTRCSAFYDDVDRAAFPPLNWSHYRAALKAKTHELAMTWLAKAADEGWSVEDLNEALKPAGNAVGGSAEKLSEFGAEFTDQTPILDAEGKVQGYTVTFRTTVSLSLVPRRIYTVKVFGVKEGEGDDE